MKVSKFFKLIFVNIILILVSLGGIELLTRIYYSRSVRSFKGLYNNLILNKGGSWVHNQGNFQRKPHPYQMFKGAPNVMDHNPLGYKITDPVSKKTINIAFFGGSTGYNGTPPIINQITGKLNALESHNIKYVPLNFSVVSSNHNQHLHSLVQNYNNYPIDIVFFYGGYNETLQTAFYDPRPGYPYNFNVRYEMTPEEMLLMKHFRFYQLIKTKFPQDYEIKPFSEKWNDAIVDNYIKTINSGRLLSKALTTGRCEIPFIFAYQPLQLSENLGVHNTFEEQVHGKIKNYLSISSDGIDLSNSFNDDKQMYTDLVHLTQKGRELVTQNILKSKIFIDVIKSCKL
tara:strand:- start:181 stop:1209 length:1029 start_codon:yes stop_codon:yes gene_type:complete